MSSSTLLADRAIAATLARRTVPRPVEASTSATPVLPWPAPGEGFGALLWRPHLASRHGVAWLACRSWRADAKASDLASFTAAKRRLDGALVAAAAADLLAVLGGMVGSLPAGWTITAVAPGHSRISENVAVQIAQQVATGLGLPWRRLFADRFMPGVSHPKQNTLLPPLAWRERPTGPVLLIDDLCTSGYHMHEALSMLRASGVPAFGIVWLAGTVQG